MRETETTCGVETGGDKRETQTGNERENSHTHTHTHTHRVDEAATHERRRPGTLQERDAAYESTREKGGRDGARV